MFGENKITGTLKYVTGYTGYSPTPELQEGHFLAFHAESEPGAEIQVTMSRTVTLEADGNCVARVADKETQTITVVASKPGCDSATVVFALDELTLVPE